MKQRISLIKMADITKVYAEMASLQRLNMLS